jgi:CBS-domain-containing membrane protein
MVMAEDSAVAEQMLVKNFVIPLKRFPHVEESKTLHEAIAVLSSFTCGPSERMRYSEILVINSANQLTGHATLENILQGLDPHLRPNVAGFQGKEADYPNLTALWGDSFFKECRGKFQRSIKEFMSPLPKSVKAGDSVLKALSIMLYARASVLPVLEQEDVIGIIRLEEIFGAIVRRCDV